MATRRQVLALGLGVLACSRAIGQPAERARYIGIETSALNGHSQTAFFTATGARLTPLALDFRAHGMAQHGSRLAVFPRRPGNRLAFVDMDTLAIEAVVTAPPERHYYGHGAFTADGRHLITTENDLESLAGGLGVYEVAGGLRRVGQVALPAPGPHEIIRVGSTDRFWVALGGVETHPDYGRTPLNLAEFRSQLVLFDAATGTVDPLGPWAGTEGISLRHMAQDGADRLYVGGQVVDAARAQPTQVLWLLEGDQIHPLAQGRDLGGYVSSVAADGQRAMVSSKESGRVLTLEGTRLVSEARIEGASAVAMGQGDTAASGFAALSLGPHQAAVTAGYEFDNHGLMLA